jgi:hypothetical protein
MVRSRIGDGVSSEDPFSSHTARRWSGGSSLSPHYHYRVLALDGFRGIYAGDDGTIWVHLHQEGVRRDPPAAAPPPPPDPPPPILWNEPNVFDVFERDGTYLGQLRIPRAPTERE